MWTLPVFSAELLPNPGPQSAPNSTNPIAPIAARRRTTPTVL
jgi:hypothetical protein